MASVSNGIAQMGNLAQTFPEAIPLLTEAIADMFSSYTSRDFSHKLLEFGKSLTAQIQAQQQAQQPPPDQPPQPSPEEQLRLQQLQQQQIQQQQEQFQQQQEHDLKMQQQQQKIQADQIQSQLTAEESVIDIARKKIKQTLEKQRVVDSLLNPSRLPTSA